MSRSSIGTLRTAALAVMMTVAAAACGGDGTGSDREVLRVQRTGGDGQGAHPGEALAEPLEVTVRGEDGQPKQGVEVEWAVTQGGGDITRSTARTGADGRATAQYTVGDEPGQNRVTATVRNGPSTPFTLTTHDPCVVPYEFSLGVEHGRLTELDCALPGGGELIDFHRLQVTQPGMYFFRVQSSAFDPFVTLQDGTGEPLAFNDDYASVFDSPPTGTFGALRVFLAPGTYVVGAGAELAGASGSYDVDAQRLASDDHQGCFKTWIVPGATTRQTITGDGCPERGEGGYFNRWYLFLEQGQQVTFTVSSADFDPQIRLVRDDGKWREAQADGVAGGAPAQVTFTVREEGDYYLVVTSARRTDLPGEYTLTVQ